MFILSMKFKKQTNLLDDLILNIHHDKWGMDLSLRIFQNAESNQKKS